MFGCLRRVVAVVLVLALGLAVFLYWYSRRGDRSATPPAAAGVVWEPLTVQGAERGEVALRSLASPQGPGVVQLSPGDVASYIFYSVGNRLPESARDVEAAVIDDELAVRGIVALRELGGARLLGPVASLIGESDTLYFSGQLSVLLPELGQYRITELRYQQFRVPAGVIPRVLAEMQRGRRPPEVAADALMVPVPPSVSDIRTGNGVITLYRSAR